ncbi:MAG: hypothetical protein M3Q58_16220 [Bacteroidota bacterium]|nr:hypothetical protein [Bacteroidota bacterium]
MKNLRFTKHSKLPVIVLLFMVGTLLGSCSKKYTCRCETNDGFVTTSEISEGSREKSAQSCASKEYSRQYELNGVTKYSTNSCKLID